MRLWFVVLILVYIRCIDGASRTVTNEDIRDAILSIVNVIRSTEDKLERHEFRERTLGDQLKKVLATIDKRQRLLDPIKGTIARLDERIATVETILLQKDERERIQVQKVFDMVEQIHRSLPQLFETLKNDITTSLGNPEEKTQEAPSNTEIEKLQKQIATKIEDTSTTVKSIEGQLTKIREENKNNFSSNQKFLEQYDNKLKEYNKQIDILPSKCKRENDLQTNVILKALEVQNLDIKKLQTEINGTNATIRDIQNKITQIHDNIEQLNEGMNKNLKQLINDTQQIGNNCNSKLEGYGNKIDVMYKNKTDSQTKEILKVFETHDTNLKRLQQEVLKIKSNTDGLTEQNTKMNKNVLLSIDKLNLLPKLVNNDEMILSESKNTQITLNKQLNNTNDLKNEIKHANDLLKKLDTTKDGLKKQIEDNFKNTWQKMEQRLSEHKKSIDGIPEKQKPQNEKIIEALNREFETLKKIVGNNSTNMNKQLAQMLKDLTSNNKQNDDIIKNLKSYITESKGRRGVILEALNLQSNKTDNKMQKVIEQIVTLQESCNQTDLLRKALEVQTKQVKKLEKHIENNTVSTTDVLQTMQVHLEQIHNNTKHHNDKSQSLKENINNNVELLQKYDAKLERYHAECKDHNNMQPVLEVLDNLTNHEFEAHNNINNQLRNIRDECTKNSALSKENLENITKLLIVTDDNKKCSKEKELNEIKNITISIQTNLDQLQNKTDNSKLLDSMKMIEELTENLNGNIGMSFGKVIDEIDNLQKLEGVIAQTTDSIIDTKRRVEYGIQQAITEISNVIKTQTKDLNTSVNSRFDNVELSLLDDEDGLLGNLTIRMAKEVDQVWKQIGMMHQQMELTNELLKTVQNQANLNGNRTINTMDNMTQKVEKMTNHVMGMDNVLNTLLRRLSLITQEFTVIKKELGKALDEMERNPLRAQNKMRPSGPGPYPI